MKKGLILTGLYSPQYCPQHALAFVAAVLCLCTACIINSNSDEGDHGEQGTEQGIDNNTVKLPELVEGVWKDGKLTKGGEVGEIKEYQISVTAGTMYFIWWDDSDNTNDRSKTCNVVVSARYYSDGTSIFTSVDTGWQRPQLFIPTSNDTVIVSVWGYRQYSHSSWPTGTYAVRYTTHSRRTALSEDAWEDDRLIADKQVNEYSFAVTSGTTYFIWWDDSDNTNNLSKTCNVVVSARYYSDGIAIFTDVNTGWQKPQLFTPTSNDTVIVSVQGYRQNSYSSSWPTGSYAVRYTTRQNRIVISANNWMNDSIIADSQVNEYSFAVQSGSTYYLWWNDSGQGDTLKTCNVVVSARYSNGTVIFTNVDSGWTTPRSFTPASSDTVIVSVQGYRRYNSDPWPTGTYAVVYTTTNNKP